MLRDLLDILLPAGGYILQIQAYFDESGSHDGSPVLCVAGYVIEKESSILMDNEWKEVLDCYNLPFFRMSACAHGRKPFDRLSGKQCSQVEEEMISIIKKYTIFGIAVTIEPNIHKDVMPVIPEIGLSTPYTFCLHSCVARVQLWADDMKCAGNIIYFFESGHKNSNEANEYMNKLFKIPYYKKPFKYIGHFFGDKEEYPILQAADLFAWQWFTYVKNSEKGKVRMRNDLTELLKENIPPHVKLHWDKEKLQPFKDKYFGDKFPLTHVKNTNILPRMKKSLGLS